jgi:hypothetical protein
MKKDYNKLYNAALKYDNIEKEFVKKYSHLFCFEIEITNHLATGDGICILDYETANVARVSDCFKDIETNGKMTRERFNKLSF